MNFMGVLSIGIWILNFYWIKKNIIYPNVFVLLIVTFTFIETSIDFLSKFF